MVTLVLCGRNDMECRDIKHNRSQICDHLDVIGVFSLYTKAEFKGYYLDWFWRHLTMKNKSLILTERVSLSILNIRNARVILDTDLSLLYGVTTIMSR